MDRISNQDLQDSSSYGDDHTAIDTLGLSIGPENPVFNPVNPVKNINRATTGTATGFRFMLPILFILSESDFLRSTISQCA